MLMRSCWIEKWCARSLRIFRASDGYNLWPDIDFSLSPVRKLYEKNEEWKWTLNLFLRFSITLDCFTFENFVHSLSSRERTFFNEFHLCRHSRIYKGQWQRKAIIMMTFAANVLNVRHSPFSSAPSIPNCNILLT